ncbi:MAG TPA: bifunctional hydroxymethylpyrimidine kinase/phosphomethylpyrimidine kinase [Spirochaetota bacterium]|nr:bifunctional hydroxymethylpyrimidine kinase/phosphomethylpyrimidine kinase [Spirochaetota bacterium]HNT12108.1 bifunctional hydroxymethylpyrimidine kinase/phosphomethylpyrimidine kinase [Spirochaetota bacterium]HOS41390.1 bifunctional hydroxymethylpyrimidine kinase/phosphomethylpyrimidine kinase [Spirochaetota bacterium]
MILPRVLTIAGSDSGGGAGIQADLKTVTVLGGYGMSVITALTAQNTQGVHGIMDVPLDFIERQFDAVLSDIGADAAKTGMLATTGVITLVARKLREYRIDHLVVDPVMVAKGGASLLATDAVRTLIDELLPLAMVVTPNVPEAEALSGMRIGGIDDCRAAAMAIHTRGARAVLVKGGHADGPNAVDVLFDGSGITEFAAPRRATSDTHGTGCTLSAAIATGLAAGRTVPEAIREAKAYITAAIEASLRLGAGHGPLNHFPDSYR